MRSWNPESPQRRLSLALAAGITGCTGHIDPQSVIAEVYPSADRHCRADPMSRGPVADNFTPCRNADRDPAGGFCDATSLWGLDATATNGRSHGISAGDIDGDGRIDLLFMNESGGNAGLELFLRAGATFVPRSDLLGAVRPSGLPTAIVDIDGDGDEDIIAAGAADGAVLYRNDGMAFTPIAFGDDPARSDVDVVMPADVDHDGMLDIVLGVYRVEAGCVTALGMHGCPGRVAVFRQASPCRFVPVPVHAPQRFVQALRMFDWDGDGNEELLVGADIGMFSGGDQILHVDHAADGTISLSDVTGTSIFGAAALAMGLTPIDIDNDGADELFVANLGFPMLYQRVDGSFLDVARHLAPDAYGLPLLHAQPHYFYFDPESAIEAPLGQFQDQFFNTHSTWEPSTKWAPAVIDYDDDGHDDLFVPSEAAGIPQYPEVARAPAQLLRGTGECLTDATSENHLLVHGSGASVVAADFDGDGDLDLAMVQDAATSTGEDRVHLLRNDVAGGHALTVVAHGLGSAREGIGAVVEIRYGSTVRRKRIDGHTSLLGTGPHVARFGLGNSTVVDSVTVRFVDGVVVQRSAVPAGTIVVNE